MNRYDTYGRDVEKVKISVLRINNRVHLYIEGEKKDLRYVMSYEEWVELAKDVTY